MASSRSETQITWSSASSITLSASGRQDSDAFAFNVEDWEAELQIDANNAGTPASGDLLYVYVKYTTGDILGDSGDDYDTDEHAQLVAVLDTYGSNTPGENPARVTVPLRTAAKGCKVSVEAPQAGSRNIVARARVCTHRVQ